MLHARSRALTHSSYSLDLLRSLIVPNQREVDMSPLVRVFAEIRHRTIKPRRDMDTCRVRASIDEAAAQVLHMDGEKISDWRRWITLEPTVSNREAPT